MGSPCSSHSHWLLLCAALAYAVLWPCPLTLPPSGALLVELVSLYPTTMVHTSAHQSGGLNILTQDLHLVKELFPSICCWCTVNISINCCEEISIYCSFDRQELASKEQKQSSSFASNTSFNSNQLPTLAHCVTVGWRSSTAHRVQWISFIKK